jgi:hypothetical protein
MGPGSAAHRYALRNVRGMETGCVSRTQRGTQ